MIVVAVERTGERERDGDNAAVVAVAIFAGEPLGVVVVVVLDLESPGWVAGTLKGDGQGIDLVVLWDRDVL